MILFILAIVCIVFGVLDYLSKRHMAKKKAAIISLAIFAISYGIIVCSYLHIPVNPLSLIYELIKDLPPAFP